ncbi:MAG TPA: lipid A deacylase LpxR family protein, partial [Puia sp.]
MKHFLRWTITLMVIVCDAGESLFAQEKTPDFLLRIYEDNDFINSLGVGTDDAYTNGTRIDLFYTKKHSPRGLDRFLPTAGAGSINTYGWGIMQLMFTPEDITRTEYQPNDYPYSGALIATHTLYSYDTVKKLDWQTELVAGVIGPASLAAETQTFVHRLIHYYKPMGWSHQYKNDLLLNINLTREKELASWGHGVEVIGGTQVFLGTMLNGMTFYPLIRIGKMSPYFQGYMSQYSSPGTSARNKHVKKWQAYFVLKPEAQLIFTNALLEGGMFTGNPNLKAAHKGDQPLPYHELEKWVYSFNYGAVVSPGNFSISFM